MRFRAFALTLAMAVVGSSAWAQATPAQPAMPAMPGMDSAMHGATATGKATAQSLVNLNTATRDQLAALPGLKDYADKIIKARPFSDISQLVSKKIVPQSVFDKVKGLITVAPH